MKQARTVISTYSADVFGVCSALYELGGMIVMHDASGCNSTYSTHDEPRWYHSDSLIFISGLTETDAILGNDQKLIDDMLSAIKQLQPAFSAIAGTPIPMMNGCDIESIARKVEKESQIPCFGFDTNGMRSYLCGASEALAAFARRMTRREVEKRPGTVNILGATPLDLSLSGTEISVKKLLAQNGWETIGTWAMGSSLEELRNAGKAEVNLVISSVGMKTAKVLEELFGTPYVVGLPVGDGFSKLVLQFLKDAAKDGNSRAAFSKFVPNADETSFIIGESVISRSMAAALGEKQGSVPKVICPLEELPELEGILSKEDISASEEEEIQSACTCAKSVMADPLYRPILPADCRFSPLPHEAFSGRMFRKNMPDMVGTSVCGSSHLPSKL